ncbi:MAG: hypothetical protein NTU80_10940 [Verrucomicrobia bacterium]|nr:hypothetical protein [Verrucomicrobiota bacterium]
MRLRAIWLVVLLGLSVRFNAVAQTIPETWLSAPPGLAQAQAIEEGASRYGWPDMAAALRSSALTVYARGNLPVAEAWRNVARWAAAWAEPTGEHLERWRTAMKSAGWQAAPAEAEGPRIEQAVAGAMAAPLRQWVLANPAFSAEYFKLEGEADFRPRVYEILSELYATDRSLFATYASLAAAIALVYDTRPPPEWPHWQVSPEVLPRRLARPSEAFTYFAGLDRSGKSLQPLSKLDAAELRFQVDLALPEAERRWALERVKTPLSKLEATYTDIRYREDRIQQGAYVWPGKDYSLAEILREGGICVDQAYYATQAGKARGVPTLLFSGAGKDGRHAWFGYLGVGKKWKMDAGRYADQRFLTGGAIDPLSWTEISDHEIAFLSEGFRNERNAREAAVHAGFARWRLADGNRAGAEQAARAAVRLERRTLEGWDILLELRPEPGRERESVAYEAAGGLASYPELQARYLGVATDSLRRRGEGARADFEERERIRKFRATRDDLSVQQVAEQMTRARTEQSIEQQIKLYGTLLRQFGRGSGTAMWDEVVRPFLNHLVNQGMLNEARLALRTAREQMAVSPDSQTWAEMATVEARMAAGEKKPAKPSTSP